MRGSSLMQRFAAVSLVLVVVLGVLMAQLLSAMISRRALQAAADATALSAAVAFQPLLAPEDLDGKLSAETVAGLDRAVERFSDRSEIARIKIWARDGAQLYVADPQTRLPKAATTEGGGSHAMEHALEGEVEAEIIEDSDEPGNAPLLARYGSLLEVYVPITYAGQDEPAGVFELYLPYGPVGDSIRADTLQTIGLLALGLLILWAGLFQTMATASRRLREQSRQTEHQARHDALTGLPNRTALHDRIERELAETHGRSTALVLLDLDRFREVNDTLGHRHGDVLLREAAHRLRAHTGTSGIVARLGGDEYGVLLTGVADATEAMVAAEAMRDALRVPIEVDGVTLVVEASAGISMHPDDADDASTMLQHADIGLYVAKRTHSGTALYDRAVDEHSPERLHLLADLARALENDELVLHYQPKIGLDGAVHGVEALVRWQHPERGLLLPAAFVPAAERTGLIHPLTEVVLGRAVAQARAWWDAGTPTRIAVNVSTRSLLDAGFADRVLGHLSAHRTPPSLLCLEITETTIMEDPDRALVVLTRLAEAGIRLSIDDFGTGYSSLAYLKTLPVHELKIDRSFVGAMTRSAPDRVIVDSTVSLGRRLGLDVVAEGVEDEATRSALTDMGCEFAQGFLFARPAPASDLRPGVDLPASDPTSQVRLAG